MSEYISHEADYEHFALSHRHALPVVPAGVPLHCVPQTDPEGIPEIACPHVEEVGEPAEDPAVKEDALYLSLYPR